MLSALGFNPQRPYRESNQLPAGEIFRRSRETGVEVAGIKSGPQKAEQRLVFWLPLARCSFLPRQKWEHVCFYPPRAQELWEPIPRRKTEGQIGLN